MRCADRPENPLTTMTTQKHIVFHVLSAWGTSAFRIAVILVKLATGHMKPLLAFVARIAERRPDSAVLMTILTSGAILPKIERELARMPGGVSGRVKFVSFLYRAPAHYSPSSLYSIIDIVGPKADALADTTQFGPAFAALWERQPVECITTKRKFVGLPRPTLSVISVRCDRHHFSRVNEFDAS
jgi:hypothetical protein